MKKLKEIIKTGLIDMGNGALRMYKEIHKTVAFLKRHQVDY